MATLGKMIRIAATSHEKQLDDGGKPYILHTIRVMMGVAHHDDEEIMTIAVGHDLLEDDPEWTIERLRAEGFSERVLTALSLLTHPKHEPYAQYIQRVSTNIDATLVKLADLRDNSDITRLKGIREKDTKRMEKYHRAFLFLTQVLKTRKEIYGEVV